MSQHVDITPSEDQPPDMALAAEWLLTNGRGSFACGTAAGLNTRKYHGLLVAAVRPPGERAALLANMVEELAVGGESFPLSCFEFDGVIHPRGDRLLVGFDIDKQSGTVAWTYRLGQFTLTRRLALARKVDAIAVRYELVGPGECDGGNARLRIAPLFAYRHYHETRHAAGGPGVGQIWDGHLLRVHDPAGQLPGMRMSTPPGVHLQADAEAGQLENFESAPEWWYRFYYRAEADRGENPWEDLFSPGRFTMSLPVGGSVELLAAAEPFELMSFDQIVAGQRAHHSGLLRVASKASGLFAESPSLPAPLSPGQTGAADLLAAADDFIVHTPGGRTSILAGFPWFADWGRDAFISLPGLLLSTGRYDEASGVLTRFAGAIRDGLVPNRFSDAATGPAGQQGEGAGEPCDYNSVDAGLWLIHAAFAWADATGQWAKFDRELLGPVRNILHAYDGGTLFNIRVDSDGLLISGDETVQVTWMDAMIEQGRPITPRAGKCVEINALFGYALGRVAARLVKIGDPEATTFAERRGRWAESFAAAFPSPRGGLCDYIGLDGQPNLLIRPNQLLAVSLGDSPLPVNLQREVVQLAIDELLTPVGLRTLARGQPGYQPTCHGDRWRRDNAYHQGTVWAWLVGPFIEAYLRVNEFSEDAKRRSWERISPLLEHMKSAGCLGQASEIFDGDEPHTPRGAFAQAWSVAELLRVLTLIEQQ